MHDSLAFSMVGVSLLCLLWVMFDCNSHVFSIGMHDGLGMGWIWSCNGKKL